MKVLEKLYLEHLIDSVSRENKIKCVGENLSSGELSKLFFSLTDLANEVTLELTGEKRLGSDITWTNCFVLELDDEDVYILGKIGSFFEENDSDSNEEIWIYRNTLKNRQPFDSGLFGYYNLSENETAKKLILKLKSTQLTQKP